MATAPNAVTARWTPDKAALKSPQALFIGGEWVRSQSERTLEVISPATEDVLIKGPEAS